MDLHGQLAGWGQHEGNRSVAGHQLGLGTDVDNGGENVGKGLARAGLGDAHHVPSTQGHGPSLLLNGSGLLEAQADELVEDEL